LQSAQTPLPPRVQAAIDQEMHTMQSHPRHHLLAYYRLQIYLALNTFNTQPAARPPRVPTVGNVGDRVRGWLAILAAERVLPIFEQGVFSPDDLVEEDRKLPITLLAMAKNLMQGSVSPEELDQANMEVHGADQEIALWLNDTRFEPVFPVNAVLAGQACQRALGEVLGWYLLESLSHYGKGYFVQKPGDMASGASSTFQHRASEELTDEQFVWSKAETAGSAAVASACSAPSIECDPERLQDFWKWWLTEAIPEAWQMVADENQGFASR
jgi:hypothetical protein